MDDLRGGEAPVSPSHKGGETLETGRAAWGRNPWWLAVPLVLLIALAFWPVLDNGFVRFDDDENFFENVEYRGLGLSQIGWAWSTFLLGVYQPFAWLILEAEYVVWGLDPRGYHAASLVMHCANGVVLYLLIVALLDRALSGGIRESRWAVHLGAVIGALLFAIHPLRVEVVSWASCQPYLPCVLFAMLSLLAYLKANRPDSIHRWRHLTISCVLFASALLCKAVAVSLPFVLVVLDVYPLRRLGPGRWLGKKELDVWKEKVPYLALSMAFMVVAVLAKRSNQSLRSVVDYGVFARLAQSCYGIWFYLVKTLLPVDLVAYYPLPRPEAFATWPYVLSMLATVGVTAAFFAVRRRWPGWLAAWVVYLVVLAPNMGIVQIGNQVAADRYSYAASLAWAVLLACGLALLAQRASGRPSLARIASVSGLLLAVTLTILTWKQCATWRTTESLWAQVLAHGDRRSATVHFNLGADLARRGKYREAMEHYAEALRLDPRSPDAHNLMGAALDHEGRAAEAFDCYLKATRLDPEYPDAENNVGSALARQGRRRDAIIHFAAAVRLKPIFPLAQRNLGLALSREGRLREAIPHLAEAARLDPGDVEAWHALGVALARSERFNEARSALAEAVRLRPSSAPLRINLGMSLESLDRLDDAIGQYTSAARLDPVRAESHLLLGQALARRGRVEAATAELSEALRLDPGNDDALRSLEALRRDRVR